MIKGYMIVGIDSGPLQGIELYAGPERGDLCAASSFG